MAQGPEQFEDRIRNLILSNVTPETKPGDSALRNRAPQSLPRNTYNKPQANNAPNRTQGARYIPQVPSLQASASQRRGNGAEFPPLGAKAPSTNTTTRSRYNPPGGTDARNASSPRVVRNSP